MNFQEFLRDLVITIIIPVGLILQNPTLKKSAKTCIVSTTVFSVLSDLSSKILSLKRKKENQIAPATQTQKVYFVKLSTHPNGANDTCVLLH
jgi:hypothetical protein